MGFEFFREYHREQAICYAWLDRRNMNISPTVVDATSIEVTGILDARAGVGRKYWRRWPFDTAARPR